VTAIGLVALTAVVTLEQGKDPLMWRFLDGTRSTLYSTLAAIASGLLGFVIAVAAIVASIMNFPELRRLRESDSFGDLWGVFLFASRWLGLTTIASLGALLIDHESAPHHVVPFVVLFVGTMAALSLARGILVLEKVLKLVSQKPKGNAPERRKSAGAPS
jgi:hypothetical protein